LAIKADLGEGGSALHRSVGAYTHDAVNRLRELQEEVTASHTNSSISLAQDAPLARRMLAAQARLYSDVKQASSVRLLVLVVLGLVLSVVSLSRSAAGSAGAGSVGGVILLFANGLLMYRERRRTAIAASIQESFDCSVFDLPWNDLSVRRRPSGQEIAAAAERYKGDRNADWYPDTGSVQRPFDIAICQQSNVGWGAPVHRAWAWTVAGFSLVTVILLGLGWTVADLSAGRGVDAFVLPFLPLVWEAFEASRTNFESARDKEDTQALILSDWAAGLEGTAPLVESRCRGYQDEIVNIRRRNAQVPDWFDRRLRGRNERAMRATADDMIAEAQRFGRA